MEKTTINKNKNISRAEYEEGIPARWLQLSVKKEDVKDMDEEEIKEFIIIDLKILSARKGYILNEEEIDFFYDKNSKKYIVYGIAYMPDDKNIITDKQIKI